MLIFDTTKPTRQGISGGKWVCFTHFPKRYVFLSKYHYIHILIFLLYYLQAKAPTPCPNFDMTKRAAPLLANAAHPTQPPYPTFDMTKRAAPSLPMSTHDFNMARRGCLLALSKCDFDMTKRDTTLLAMSNPQTGLYTHGLLKNLYPYPPKTHPRVQVRARVVAG